MVFSNSVASYLPQDDFLHTFFTHVSPPLMSRYWRVLAAYPVLVRADEANGFCKANDHSCGRAMDTFFDAPQRDDATGLETTGSICNSCFCRHIQTFTDFAYVLWAILALCVCTTHPFHPFPLEQSWFSQKQPLLGPPTALLRSGFAGWKVIQCQLWRVPLRPPC